MIDPTIILNRFWFLLFFLFAFQFTALAQNPEKLGLVPDKWAIELNKPELTELNSLGSLIQQLIDVDSLRSINFLDSLEKSRLAKGPYFKTYFSMVKAEVIYAKFAGYDKFKDRSVAQLVPIKEQLKKLYEMALEAAYQTENDKVVGWVNFYSARRILSFGEIAWAVMYSKNGVDLFEKINYPVEPHVYTELAELLAQVREYEESIIYAKKSIKSLKTTDYEDYYENSYQFKVRSNRTIGFSFYRMSVLDSAKIYLMLASKLAKENKDSILSGRVEGIIGEIIYEEAHYDSAWNFFETDYKYSLYDSAFDWAANAKQWMAKANLARGDYAGALSDAREALGLLKFWPNSQFRSDAYFTLSQIYKGLGNFDSAFYFNDRYISLNDSLEKQIIVSSLEISKARLRSEESLYRIERINKEKQKELFVRNSLIVGILGISLVGFLIVNRGRLKNKLALEKAEREKLRMELEIQSAKEQIIRFKSNIIEKTNLIEKLEEQLNGNNLLSPEQQLLIDEITQKTILTEEDWLKFKSLFDKIYPSFFQKLKKNTADITIAEQRMAALSRLELTSKQMAAMLGISVDSVHKSRQRLRQRLQLSADTNLDDYLASI